MIVPRHGNCCRDSAFQVFGIAQDSVWIPKLADDACLARRRWSSLGNSPRLAPLEKVMAARDSGTRASGKRKRTRDMTAPNANVPNRELPPDVTLGADSRTHIGHQLRAAYVEVVNEPVPNRFVRLLEELERKHGNGS